MAGHDRGYVVASAPGGRLRGGRVRFEPSSVGATINVLLGAVLAYVYRNVGKEPLPAWMQEEAEPERRDFQDFIDKYG